MADKIDVNYCKSPMMVHKITYSVVYDLGLKRSATFQMNFLSALKVIQINNPNPQFQLLLPMLLSLLDASSGNLF